MNICIYRYSICIGSYIHIKIYIYLSIYLYVNLYIKGDFSNFIWMRAHLVVPLLLC